ncbi:rCG28212 [Rattus norvegicus]|uniref:RCG28212 n=1 Tax=Rattus norvegicus TaxID=10116 RepID=A6IEC2_RAT|nr:rCG28212 [Rattus norvegicus]
MSDHMFHFPRGNIKCLQRTVTRPGRAVFFWMFPYTGKEPVYWRGVSGLSVALRWWCTVFSCWENVFLVLFVCLSPPS